MKNELHALLSEVAVAYEQSEIKKICEVGNFEWHYSLITGTLVKGGPLILGYNWGASQNETYKHKPQTTIENAIFKTQDVGSLKRIFPYCEKYFGTDFLEQTSQSNYCFFRSKNEGQISNKDIALCEPIFEKLISTLAPSYILCLSSKLRDYLISGNKLKDIESTNIHFRRGNVDTTYQAMKAKLKSGATIVFLPHPNYPMKKEAREQAWAFCCGQGS